MSDEHGAWQKWVSNGRASGVCWLIVLILNVTLRVLKIPAPEIDNLLVVLTGLFVGNLTVSKNKAGPGDGPKNE